MRAISLSLEKLSYAAFNNFLIMICWIGTYFLKYYSLIAYHSINFLIDYLDF